MGNQESSLRKTLEDEFSRLAKGRDTLSIEQLMQMKLPPNPLNLDPTHIGVLWVLDRRKTGLITLEDLTALAELGYSRIRCYQAHEFQSQMQGYCMLMLRRCIADHGTDIVCSWLIRMIVAPGKNTRFELGGDEIYVHEDMARMLHLLFRIKEIHGIEFSEFLNTLQEAGEEANLMDINDTRQDRWVPLTIVHRLLASLIDGMSKVMDEIFPVDEQLIF